MGFKLKGNGGVDVEVEATRAMRITPVNRGPGYTVQALTGTINAGLANDSTLFAMRLNPGTALRAYIERIRITYSTITALTAAVKASRYIGVFRASTAAATGGTAIATAPAKDSTSATSQFNSANGGDIRVAGVAGLTVAGIVYEANPLLIHEGEITTGAAGGGGTPFEWRNPPGDVSPIVLNPGELLTVKNQIAWDAAGTWQLIVAVDWSEVVTPT